MIDRLDEIVVLAEDLHAQQTRLSDADPQKADLIAMGEWLVDATRWMRELFDSGRDDEASTLLADLTEALEAAKRGAERMLN